MSIIKYVLLLVLLMGCGSGLKTASSSSSKENETGGPTPTPAPTTPPTTPPVTPPVTPPTTPPSLGPVNGILFLQRRINSNGSLYMPSTNDMAGVGVHSRVRPAAPGKLILRNNDGSLRILIDGANPNSSSLNIIDVSGFDLSYDAQKIVFAGLPNGNYPRGPEQNVNAWRIYSMNLDGSGLRQLTRNDQNLNYSQFSGAAGGLSGYDDFDPSWLPDGRIVFSSTRYPSFAQYAGARTSNLHVMNSDGSSMKRITTERNGADRPIIDPLTGKIVFSRWWRNFRFPMNDMSTIADPNGGYIQKDGLSADRNIQMDGTSRYQDFLFRNDWHIASINPDGTGLARLITDFEESGGGNGDWYGGAFNLDGSAIYTNFFPMFKTSEAAGFGGIRKYKRSSDEDPTHIVGVTDLSGTYVNNQEPYSYGVYVGNYASEPAVLPDGRLIVSWAADIFQDYGLYVVNPDGSNRTLLINNVGTQELRAKIVATRSLPPIIADIVTQTPSLLPPTAQGPYNNDGTFTFNALNVYANGPVDGPNILDAPPVGTASKIRFFIDHQRTSPGSFSNLDFPISLGETAISPAGAVRVDDAPANVPLFEQLRSADGSIPFTSGPFSIQESAAQVAGMNYGRPGVNARCVGCHLGHTMIPVPANDADAAFSNLAPGATVAVSSSADAQYNRGLVDRQVRKGQIWRYWRSTPGVNTNQWVKLTFKVPVSVRNVKLYNPRQGDEANSSIQVSQTTVKLCTDILCNTIVTSKNSGALSVNGTDVTFADVRARAVLVDITQVSGTFFGAAMASLAEIEIIARGESGP